MAITIDDSQLLRLAADPRTRLFPTLRGSAAFGPIVFLAGLMPCLAAALTSELNDESAAWALRAMDVASATQIQGWSEPGREGLAANLVYQPPLSAWLLAMVVRQLGTEHFASWLVISLVSACGTVWVIFLLGRRLGGAPAGLLAALLISGHPVILQMATRTSPAALGTLLIALTVWGFLGHLEGPPQLVSLRMLAGGVAWGLAILAVGPVAIALFIPMSLHVWLLAGERLRAGMAGHGESRWWQMWFGLRSLTVFVFTALSFSAWWEIMMLTNHDGSFWQSWLTGQPVEASSRDATAIFLRTWLSQNSFLCGWLAIGIVGAIREIRFPESEHSRRRSQFLLCWWLTAFGIRKVFEVTELPASVTIDAWDAMLLLPTGLLAAWGVRSTIRRQTNPILETFALAVTLGLGVWRVTDRPVPATVAALAGLLCVAILPSVVTRLRRFSKPWSERDWRKMLQVTILALLVLQLAAGLIEYPMPSSDSLSLAELRRRIATIPATPRVTVMTRATLPESLLFVLRSTWPKSQIVFTTSRDGSPANDPLTSTSPTLPSGELVIEWTRRAFRLATEFTPNRQTTAIGEPQRFRGRRLMIYRLSPRDR